uniref:Uncharacterized protein n=1 Tax=Trieres chinensis TaxID=1514140 RepID=A0A7S2EMA6_TRICV|mmetsp:Transcript_30303/g.61799  ORF Transcript_30303/g.61799 Transcript_30303/m.61799 type:complete len:245 (+) Transcript_30303:66-800(+)|eukprot:CAMPEP_0183309314 /NCGR_PEP_ID=MMETSP0160_2-20130417/24963_1 /TAXON_ID=2839 ORGANISM="Odontella Sinensis, Strain Grunow 1884" /NCGR_SAMPLE_ID=MMETSP0160_2 /ASSEMBLY_ACC=CAM_ASM_000250 /LENGTH=244 /DNA_ID=CAMNT_0025473325 /DNA_START=63 /DNA_END=797 /DNA_ORIENTATION=+
MTTATMKRFEGIKQTPETRSIIQRVLSRPSTLENDDAKTTLEQTSSIPDGEVLSLDVINAIRAIISSSDCAGSLSEEVEKALSKTSLVFSSPPPKDNKTDEEREKYAKRMARLRILAEEKNYRKLTKNIDKVVADDVTMKSMSYATSVGLNMIVAPISFGVFMYFFAGNIFGWMVDDEDGRTGKTDIKSVIAGVISGVIMLFIEMTLFVIRSHEMDASVRKKAKHSHTNPFGYHKERAKKTFTG